MPPWRRCRHAAGSLLLAFALSACGGDDSPPTVATSTTPAAAAPATSTTPPAAAPTTPSPPPAIPPAPAATVAFAIANTAPASYQWDVLGVGKTVHIDLAETFTAVPGKYKGLRFLRTANADRFLSAAERYRVSNQQGRRRSRRVRHAGGHAADLARGLDRHGGYADDVHRRVSVVAQGVCEWCREPRRQRARSQRVRRRR